MAKKVRIGDVGDALEKVLDKIKAPSNMRTYGESAADMIKTRTRLGYGVKEAGAKRQRLKPLSDDYKAKRKSAKNLKGPTTAGRSNLTYSGQLIDSTGVTSVSIGKAVVGPDSNPREGSKLTNAELAGYVTEAGRPYNNLSDVEVKRLETQIGKDLQAEVERRLTKLK